MWGGVVFGGCFGFRMLLPVEPLEGIAGQAAREAAVRELP